MAQHSKLRRRNQKQGVVLLIIATLLTLFLMIGITLSLLATGYKGTSEQIRSAGTYGDLAEKEMDLILDQLLYGASTLTAVSPHNFLADLYGHDSIKGTVQGNPQGWNDDQVLVITVNFTTAAEQAPNYYSGRVFTFITGQARGISSRVLAYSYNAMSGQATIAVEVPESDLPVAPTVAANDEFIINGGPFNGTGAGYTNVDSNGNPSYNLDATMALNALTTTPLPVALLPNYYGYPQATTVAINLGGFDENYDAADYQNMFLAMIPASLGQLGSDNASTGQDNRGEIVLLPSFHRPDLVQMWFNFLMNDPNVLGNSMANAQAKRRVILEPYGSDGIRDNGDDQNFVSYMDLSLAKRDALIQLKRSFIFRPLKEDHPNFDGGNPNFAPDLLTNNESTLGGTGSAPAPYDVDNDGDGIADSIWIDPLLPIITSRDGRKYKRLVAFLVEDLDGRINVNAHGSMAPVLITAAQADQPITGNYEFAGQAPGGMVSLTMPRGIGYGPAEVDFRHIFNYQNNIYRSLFEGYAPLQIPGRYGFDTLAGIANQDDPLSQARNLGLQQDHTANRSSYSTPPDVWGRGAMALDYYGMPLWVNTTQVGTQETEDDPYEMQVYGRHSAADLPYSPSELEPVLRYHDGGSANLYSRLFANPLTRSFLGQSSPGSIGPDNRLRRLLTTMSSHISAPPVGIPKEERTSFYTYRQQSNQNAYDTWPASTSLIDYYRYRLQGAANVDQELRNIVPFEIHHGQLLNINREFGNGYHDGVATAYPAPLPLPEDPYGVVDDPGESYINRDPMNAPNFEPRERIWPGLWDRYFEHDNDLLVATNSVPQVPGYPPYNPAGMPPQHVLYPDVRQIMARHLYCLVMLFKDRNYNYDLDQDGNPDPPQATAQMIAQWAVNAVDFRDADSICSGFEYDANPWDGWQVDGNLVTRTDSDPNQGGVGGVVWGTERPELLLTETLAFHDRRTEDLSTDPSGQMEPGDEDWDSRLRPRGSFFVELYNPWYDRGNTGVNLGYDHQAPELYFNRGVELGRVNMDPDGTGPQPGTGSPVWRLLVVGGSPTINGSPVTHDAADPDVPTPEQLTTSNQVERSVYFADLSTGVTIPTGHGEAYFPSGGIAKSVVRPGRYAVIGSSGVFDATTGNYVTYIGRRTDATDGYDPALLNLADTRRIELYPHTDPDQAYVRLVDNSQPAMEDIDRADLQPTVALPIDTVMRGGVPVNQSLSISEPVGGYVTPAGSAYIPPSPTDEGHYEPATDDPLDKNRGAEWDFLLNTGTQANFRTVHLQRLANPLLPWNALTNPYLTIDSSSVDVTAFNGAKDDSGSQAVVQNTTNFQTFQRGGPFTATVGGVNGYAEPGFTFRGYRNLWRQEPFHAPPSADSPNMDPGGTGPHYFSYQLYHTLGHLNRRYWPYFTSMSGVSQPYFGAPAQTDGEPTSSVPRSFSWLTHLDRPFTSPMELLLVSNQPSSQLLRKYNMQNSAQPLNTAYVATNMSDPHPHLLNFFQTTSTVTATDAPNLCRIFDYMEVPSPYVGAERYFSPQEFQTDQSNPQRLGTFRPPFSKASRFRDPGRININTIYDGAVWEAIAKTMPGMDPSVNGAQFFQDLMTSRQGYAAQLLTINNTYPSLFSNPFRSADTADMMPPIPALRQSAAHGSLLRGTPPVSPASSPLFASNSTQPYEEAGRNPYFRFQGLQKVSNMVTTRSNCFAVWVTVGYFEVEQNPPSPVNNNGVDAAHPDGYRLGQEVGADSGGAVRHRMFAIVDRSIPVAYEPGKRHNADKMVLLRRFIE